MKRKTLRQIVNEEPFSDYNDWWQVGQTFTQFMSEAIVSPWFELHRNDGNLDSVQTYVSDYVNLVYGRQANPSLLEDFVNPPSTCPLQSGEFDALSYAFYRSAFELIQIHLEAYAHSLEQERRLFTKRVGRIFFSLVQNHLRLDLPLGLNNEQEFSQLKVGLHQVGNFLQRQGYLRDHFKFSFEVDVNYAGRSIKQTEADFLTGLHRNGLAYALYEMGYPVILPSAVYLYHTIGEAQHHSSRIIEELFGLIGYEARETDDFDPTGHPSKLVVELWEIRRLADKIH
jgi:hypothetical protein